MGKASTEKQRRNKGDRDERGRFTKDTPTAFKPGQSGNPAGRPKSITLSEALRLELAKVLPNDTQERTFAEVIAQSLVLAAATGNILAAKEIADRTEGKPKQAIAMDVSVTDWRELARQHGLSETDVILEAKRLITESGLDSSGATSH
jgi:hypothetical protein